jgi:hypothetical protein
VIHSCQTLLRQQDYQLRILYYCVSSWESLFADKKLQQILPDSILFRKKENKRNMPGWAPKAITFKFSGKRGYMPGEPRPDGKTTPQQQKTTVS